MNSSILLKFVIKGTIQDSWGPISENSGLALGGPRRMSCTRTGLRGCIWNVWDQRSSKDAPRDHDLDTAARHLDPSGPKPAQGPDTFPNFFSENRRNHESPPKIFPAGASRRRKNRDLALRCSSSGTMRWLTQEPNQKPQGFPKGLVDPGTFHFLLFFK